MRSVCVMCGRKTVPAVMLGSEPVGPTCARRLGLLGMTPPKGGRVRVFSGRQSQHRADVQTIDMFRERGL